MSHAKRKGKGGRAGSRKDDRRGIPWGTIIIAVVIITGAAAYLMVRYGAVRLSLPAGDRYRKPQSSTLLLYFADAQGEHLKAEERQIAAEPALEARIDRAVRELLKGPRGSLERTVPPSVELKNVRMKGDRVAWINFSPTFVTAHPGGSTAELMTVYSIVNTVALNFSEVQKVGILVDGRPIDTLAGHLDCREPFVADTTLIQ